MTDTTVVFGASSYVGSTLTHKLLERGNRVIAVSRRPAIARILLPERSENLSIASAGDIAGLTHGEDVSIVNFAYVKNAPPQLLYRQNKALVRAIGEVAAAGCRRLIHISTSAVFGPRLETNPEPSRVRSAPVEDLYAESKVHAEHMIEGLHGTAGGELAILRLGNVIGPGSPLWVAGLAQRIMEVKPVGYEGEDGFSNATHVDNIADYVTHLLGQPQGRLGDFGAYHHLAEFSSRRWSELVDALSAAVGYPWTTVSRDTEPAPRSQPVKRALKAMYATHAGAHVRRAWGVLPEWQALDRLFAGMRDPRPPTLRTERDSVLEAIALFEVLSCPREFRSQTIDGWTPPLDFRAADDTIGDWLRGAGYSLGLGERESGR
jgi:nucleoside-diphosphate-sugar epimerase